MKTQGYVPVVTNYTFSGLPEIEKIIHRENQALKGCNIYAQGEALGNQFIEKLISLLNL